MQLGKFSVSLCVSDLQASKTFYRKFGFESVGGEEDQGWMILANGECTIGLFYGMFDKNILTFNPGWKAEGKPLGEFADIREIQRDLKSQGMEFVSEADETSSGPASFMLTDPDGNQILVDQHI